jgi:hypothetical protein
MKTIFILFVLAFLIGCSGTQFTEVRSNLSDHLVKTSERIICQDIPIGDWLRLYASNPVRVQGWRNICENTITFTPDK